MLLFLKRGSWQSHQNFITFCLNFGGFLLNHYQNIVILYIFQKFCGRVGQNRLVGEGDNCVLMPYGRYGTEQLLITQIKCPF